MEPELGLAYFIVATVVTLIVEQIRKLSEKIDGRLVNLVAWAVGFGATFAPIAAFAAFNDLLPDIVLEGRLTAGIALAGLSSLVAEAKGVLTNTRKLKKETLDAMGQGDEAYPQGESRYDEGYNPGDPGYGSNRESTELPPV